MIRHAGGDHAIVNVQASSRSGTARGSRIVDDVPPERDENMKIRRRHLVIAVVVLTLVLVLLFRLSAGHIGVPGMCPAPPG